MSAQEYDEVSQNTVVLQIITDASGKNTVRFEFPTIDPDLAEKLRPQPKISQDNAANDEADEIFRKKKTEDRDSAKRLATLSSDWTSTSIGFFEIIPEFASRNFEFAEAGLMENLVSYVETIAIEKDETDSDEGHKLREYSVSYDHLAIIAKLLGRSTQTLKAVKTMSRAALGALVSEYEAFFAALVRIMAHNNPSVLISEDEAISVKRLQEFSSFEEFMDDLIDEKISDLMQSKSHYQLLKWLEEKFGVNLSSNSQLMAEFVEICQRRHLIAHAGGVVNRKYLKVCCEHGCKLDNLPKLGEEVLVSRKYLRSATARIFQVGFFSLHIIWQKVLSEHKEHSVHALLQVSHDFLDNNLTKMCSRVCEFVLNSKTDLSGRQRAYFVINLAQSHLFDPKADEEHRGRRVEAALRKHDWSITSPIVDLALACVRRQTDNLSDLTEKACRDGLDFNSAMTWSVFRDVRQMPEFKKHFQEVQKS